jgi:hypothetical protein
MPPVLLFRPCWPPPLLPHPAQGNLDWFQFAFLREVSAPVDKNVLVAERNADAEAMCQRAGPMTDERACRAIGSKINAPLRPMRLRCHAVPYPFSVAERAYTVGSAAS